MDYMGVLARATSLAWHNKKLWVFGFLVALFSGGGRFNWTFNGSDMRSFRPTPSMMGWQLTPGLVAAVVVAGTVVVLIAVAINMTSAAALMQSVRDADNGRTVSLRRGFGAGFRRLWSYFWLNVVVGLPAAFLSIGLVLLATLPVILAAMLTRGQPREIWPAVVLTMLLMIPVVLLLIAVFSLISLAMEFVLRACVLEKLGVGASLSHGWDIFAGHFWQALVLAVLLFGCGLVFGVVLIPLALGFVAVAFAGGAMVWAAFRDMVAAVIVGGVLFLPGALVLLTLQGAFTAFTSGAWTLMYGKLAGLDVAAVEQAAAPAVAPEVAPAVAPVEVAAP